MEKVLGYHGAIIWKKANGIYHSPVVPYHERKSFSVSQTFEQDINDVVRIKSVLVAMVERLGFYLRKGTKQTSCVVVTVRYSDFKTTSKQCAIDSTSDDAILIKHVLELFDAHYTFGKKVRLVGVRYSNLDDGLGQINLFDNLEEKTELYSALDVIRTKFGKDAIKRAVTLDVKRVGMAHNPFNGKEN